MKLSEVMSAILIPAMAQLPAKMSSDKASVMLLSIGLQESRFEFTRQMGNGPAASYWQGEQGGGLVTGVMNHPATKDIAAGLYASHNVAPTPAAVWQAIQTDQILACALARLLLWSDPKPLPEVHDTDAAWLTYKSIWRPGKPHPETWAGYHAAALDCLGIT